MSQFVADVKKIRDRARMHIEKGAVTEGYKADQRTGDEGTERRPCD